MPSGVVVVENGCRWWDVGHPKADAGEKTRGNFRGRIGLRFAPFFLGGGGKKVGFGCGPWLNEAPTIQFPYVPRSSNS